MNCPYCGSPLEEECKFCPVCGANLEVNPQNVQPQQAIYNNNANYDAYRQQQQQERNSGFAIAGFVLSIISIIFIWCCCAGFPLALLGLIFGIIGLKAVSKKSFAIAAIVISAIILASSLFWTFFNATTTNYWDIIEQYQENPNDFEWDEFWNEAR